MLSVAGQRCSHFFARVVIPACTIVALVAFPRTLGADPIVGEDGSLWNPNTAVVRTVHTAATASGVPTLNVAIIASASGDVTDPFFTDSENRIVGSGLFASVTVINAGLVTPTVVELQAFDAVLVWSNFAFADDDLLGNRLADYVDDGGGVVLAVFANTTQTLGHELGGRWAIAEYWVVPPGGGTTSGTVATLGTVHDSGHTIMTGVSTFDGGSSSFRPAESTIISSGTLIAEWSDGSTLAAVREDTIGARVALGFYPPSDVVLANFWDAATDGGVLLSNALLYAAQRTPLPLGDSDDDGDVDLDDFAKFDTCVNADPSVFALAGCIVFDLDGDKNVDCDDWVALPGVWTAPDAIPLPFACTEIIPAASTWGVSIFALATLIAGTIMQRRRMVTD